MKPHQSIEAKPKAYKFKGITYFYKRCKNKRINPKIMNRSKTSGTMRKCLLVLFILFIFSSMCFSIDMKFKFSGGLSRLNLRDINKSLKDWNEGLRLEATNTNNWSFIGGEVSDFHSAYDFEGELMIFVASNLSTSLATGYIYGEIDQKGTELFIERPVGMYTYIRPTKASAIPLVLNLYYFYPVQKKLHVFLKGGSGILWARYVEREGRKLETAEKFSYPILQTTSATGQLFLGSIGVTYNFEPGMSFFVESSYRFAKISGFQGENKEGESGTLFYFEEYNPDFNFWQAKNLLLTEDPSGENFRSVQKAVVDFSGFSIKIGFMINF